VTIERMTIRNGDYGIRSTSGNVDVLHCTFYHNGWDGTAPPSADPPTCANINTWWTTYCTDGGAMRIENSLGSEIAYCTVYNNDRSIRYQDGDLGDIHDNVAHDNVQAGIYLAASSYSGATGCSNTNVYDNESYDNMEHGLLSIGGINNTFTNNNVHGNWNAGVRLWHVGETTIQNNTITGNGLYTCNGWGPADTVAGVGVQSTGSVIDGSATFVARLLGNTFASHDIDVLIEHEADTTVVNNNNFSGTTYGVQNTDTGVELDAENNWWGAVDGPGSVGPGSGAPVSTDVDYDPYLTESYPPAAAASGCFIATAAYGTEAAAEIDVLRSFRDEVLLESTLGSQLVELYYQTSPPLADFISKNSLLRTLVRELVIDPMVSIATFTQGIWGK